MKNFILGILAGAAAVGLCALGWILHGSVGGTSEPSQAPAAASVANAAPANPPFHPPPTPPPSIPLVSMSDFQRLRAARDAVFQANPDLADEYKKIISEMQTQQTELDAAMIKADPKVASIVAKLVALRQRNSARLAPASPTSGSR
ncbi:MAG TPA: hypothetical protein VL981_00905 [Candidatus Methylacidiphilales bacterium]|nr:hypothetical protein [Candidatus Methylacidiphilales bacterium]